MKKVVFYGRYSSVMQNEQSIEGQLHVCRQYAESNGLEIIGEYIDRAMTGTSDKRPEFQRMISDSESGHFESVLVYKLDRFARNRYDSALYKKKLRQNGVSVISATEQLSDTPEGILMEAIIEGMDEFYSAELGRKLRRGREMSFRKGRFIGKRPPFGFAVRDGMIALDEERVPIVREIFERYASGEKQAHIVADLNRRGIPNAAGNPWNKGNLSYMFQCRLYIGEYTLKSVDMVQSCPAIISRELYDKVQAVKADSVHRSRECKTNYNYVLTGHMTCAKCGAAVCGVSMSHGKYHYYQCHKHCGLRIPADVLHDRVRDALAKHLTGDKLEELAAAAYAEYAKYEPPAERECIEHELADVEVRLKNAVNAVLSGINSPTLKDTIESLEAEKKSLSKRMEDVSAAPPKFSQEQFRLALEYIIATAQEGDLSKLVSTVIDRIIIDDQSATICINLTDTNNSPPLEQILFRVGEYSCSITQNIIIHENGWLIIPA